MTGSLGSIIQEVLFVTGEYSTTRNRLLLIGYRQCVGYPLAELLRLRYAAQDEVSNHPASSPQVWVLSSSVATFRAGSSRTCGRPLQGSSQRDTSVDLNFCNKCLEERLRTELDALGDLMRLRISPPKSLFETTLFLHRCSSNYWCVWATHLYC